MRLFSKALMMRPDWGRRIFTRLERSNVTFLSTGNLQIYHRLVLKVLMLGYYLLAIQFIQHILKLHWVVIFYFGFLQIFSLLQLVIHRIFYIWLSHQQIVCIFSGIIFLVTEYTKETCGLSSRIRLLIFVNRQLFCLLPFSWLLTFWLLIAKF